MWWTLLTLVWCAAGYHLKDLAAWLTPRLQSYLLAERVAECLGNTRLFDADLIPGASEGVEKLVALYHSARFEVAQHANAEILHRVIEDRVSRERVQLMARQMRMRADDEIFAMAEGGFTAEQRFFLQRLGLEIREHLSFDLCHYGTYVGATLTPFCVPYLRDLTPRCL